MNKLPDILANAETRKDTIRFYRSWFNVIPDLKSAILFGAIVAPFWILKSGSVAGFDADSAAAAKVSFTEITAKSVEAAIGERLTAKRHLAVLVRKGLLKKTRARQDDIVDLLKRKTPQRIGGCNLFCSWCSGNTYLLQEHHYPVPRSQGGIDTVKICPNCHYEYHHLMQQSFYVLTEKAITLVLGSQ